MRILLLILLTALTAQAQLDFKKLMQRRQAVAEVVDYPLDDTATNAYAAWSVGRTLTNAWTSALALVVRSSDGATNYVVTGSSSEISSLVSWAGSGDAYVTNLFDQTGNGRHMVQGNTNLCPRIITNGVAVAKNSKLVMRFGRNNYLFTASLSPSLPLSYLLCLHNVARTSGDVVFCGNSSTRTAIKQGSTAVYSVDSGGTPVTSSDALTVGQWESATAVFATGNDSIQVNGGSQASGAAGDNSATALVIGFPGTGADMMVSDFYVWNALMPDPAGTGPVRTNTATFYSFP